MASGKKNNRKASCQYIGVLAVGIACPEDLEPSDYPRLNYIPLGLQLAIMDLLSVFDVYGKNTYASMVPFSNFSA
jgi:hypothetical protein